MTEPRIRPPAALEESVLDPLKDLGFFPSKAHAMMFAGCLGFYLSKKSTPGSFGEGIKRDYFDEEARVIDLIAVAAQRRLDAISDDNRKVAQEIFEQYASAGLEAINEACFSGRRTPLEGLLELMSSKPTGRLPKLI